MEFPSILIGLIILGVSTYFVMLPFQKSQLKKLKPSPVASQTANRREGVISALRDLDFDFKTGKVVEEDYTPLRSRLLVEAAQYMEQEKEDDQRIEALIQSRRAAREHGETCDHCGARVTADQHFCAKCGSPLSHETCPHCGKKTQPGDQFCVSCGTSLKVQMEATAQ